MSSGGLLVTQTEDERQAPASGGNRAAAGGGERAAASTGGRFASASLPRHLARGLIGFGAMAAGLALVPVLGPAALLLVSAGLVPLRGCPMCWTMGLVQTLSAGRVRRECVDGRCELRVPGRAPQG